jgi:hypothetical protein
MALQTKILDKYIQSIFEEAKSSASHQVIHQARSSLLNKAVEKSYKSFIRRFVVNLCKDTLEK